MAQFLDGEAEMSGGEHEDGYDEDLDDAGSLKDFVVSDDEESGEEGEEQEQEQDFPEPELTAEEQQAKEAEQTMIKKEKKRRRKMDIERERLELLRDEIEEKQKKLERSSGKGKRRRTIQCNEGSDDESSEEEENTENTSMVNRKIISSRSLVAPQQRRPPTPPTTTRVQVPAAVVPLGITAGLLSPQIHRLRDMNVDTTTPRSVQPSAPSPPSIPPPSRPAVVTNGSSTLMPPGRFRMTPLQPEEAPKPVTNSAKWDWFKATGGSTAPPPAQSDALKYRGTGYVLVKGTLCRHKDGVVQPSTGVDD